MQFMMKLLCVRLLSVCLLTFLRELSFVCLFCDCLCTFLCDVLNMSFVVCIVHTHLRARPHVCRVGARSLHASSPAHVLRLARSFAVLFSSQLTMCIASGPPLWSVQRSSAFASFSCRSCSNVMGLGTAVFRSSIGTQRFSALASCNDTRNLPVFTLAYQGALRSHLPPKSGSPLALHRRKRPTAGTQRFACLE